MLTSKGKIVSIASSDAEFRGSNLIKWQMAVVLDTAKEIDRRQPTTSATALHYRLQESGRQREALGTEDIAEACEISLLVDVAWLYIDVLLCVCHILDGTCV